VLQLGNAGDERNKPGQNSWAYLPHRNAGRLIQYIAFRLSNNLPQGASDHLERSIAQLELGGPRVGGPKVGDLEPYGSGTTGIGSSGMNKVNHSGLGYSLINTAE